MWIYNNNELTTIPSEAYGYVYLITNKITNKKYIGKKLFWFIKQKPIKGKRKKIKTVS